VDLIQPLAEFLLPGIVVTGSATLLASGTTIGQKALEENHLGSIAIASFLVAASYIVGILCSELGTALVKPQGDKIARTQITARLTDLKRTPWGAFRDPGRRLGWSDFSYLRGACRSSDGVRDKIEAHENVLRVLRSSLSALPLSVLFATIYVELNEHYIAVINVLIAVALTLATAFLTLSAFRQRLAVSVRSSIDHYLVINANSRPEQLMAEIEGGLNETKADSHLESGGGGS
jgi:hypothetical protein